MHNFVLSPIDPENLINSISERVTANILKAVRNEHQTNNHPERKLNAPNAAEFLGITLPTLYSKCSKGELPVCKAPGSKRLFFFEKDLINYLKSGRKKSNTEIQAEAEKYFNKIGGNYGK